ncbi:MAG: lasso peptide biosynthesis PqqD family chaperone [Clostridium perfringens]|nr:lasso peptide biosynthesis PqqD family chaperone [Clostridium perfringens]
MRRKIDLNLENIVVQNKEIDVSDLNGEKVMMNIDKGEYFSLNSLGSRVWELIETPRKINDVIDILLKEYEVSEKECKDSVMKFMDVLSYVDLISIN